MQLADRLKRVVEAELASNPALEWVDKLLSNDDKEFEDFLNKRYSKQGSRNHKQTHRSNTQNETSEAYRDPELAGYYANLEAPYGADLETVRKSWKRLLAKYHPDLHSSDPEKQKLATELTKGLNKAYRALEQRLNP